VTFDLRYKEEGVLSERGLEQGVPLERLPAWFRDEPAVLGGLDLYLAAYWDLATERPVGQSIGPIPTSKIREYGSRIGLSFPMIEVLVGVIRRADSAHLEWMREDFKKQKATEVAKRKGGD
jgi:hypothetical protein